MRSPSPRRVIAPLLVCGIAPLLACSIAPAAAFAAALAAQEPTPAAKPATAPAPAASTAEVDAFLEAWARKMGETKSLQMRFRQEKKLRILRRPKVSDGDLAYADGKLSVRVTGRDGAVESELLLRDGELKILYPDLKRLEVIELGKGAGGAPVSIPFFAGDPRDARKDYAVTLVRSDAEDVLTLVPAAKDSPVRRLEMRLQAFELKEYRQVDKNGDELRMQVQAVRLNEPVAPGRFALDVPAGTTVVHPAGK